MDGLSRKLADVALSGPNDEREEFVRQSQKGRPISDGRGQALSESSLDRDRYMAKACKGESASKAAIPSNLIKAGRRRPENQERPHVSLYHDSFARFRAKIKDTSLEIPADVYSDVTQLFGVAQVVYKEERFRALAIESHLVKLMGDTYASQSVEGAQPDGVVTSTMPGRPKAYRCFLEVKNEIGTGGCDPCSQGFIGYEKFWSEEKVW